MIINKYHHLMSNDSNIPATQQVITSSDSANSSAVPTQFIQDLRADILHHFESLQLPALNGGINGPLSKETIRASHAHQRSEIFQREYKVLARDWDHLLRHFANGDEVIPQSIIPELVPVSSMDETGRLFRFASLLWSVPVSQGYGRRMRFLVRDRSNNKLIGIFALGDPVFNLQCRDRWIGWDVNDRRSRLVNVMDAYVLGAVPPYNQLLGGKLIASLIGSTEVNQLFLSRYSTSMGVISKQKKSPRLVLVTVTSALGRSSLYNRLKLVQGERILIHYLHIGETRGFGHFQISNSLFERIRTLLAFENHPYASGNRFGQGPNWRLRVIRVGLARLGLDENLVQHGINRQVYAMPLAPDFKEFLCGQIPEPVIDCRPVSEIARAALDRWIIPRALRYPEYISFHREQFLKEFQFV
jgi:hypothetical protein